MEQEKRWYAYGQRKRGREETNTKHRCNGVKAPGHYLSGGGIPHPLTLILRWTVGNASDTI